MKLLLADDHTLFRDALVQYITRADPKAEVAVAKDFPEALDTVREHPDQDLVMLDLRMPGMDGMNGFKMMQEDYPDIPVVLMSGVAESCDVQAAMDLGAAGYFPKTLSGKALLQAIEVVLSGKSFVPQDPDSNTFMKSYHADRAPVAPVSAAGGLHEEQQALEMPVDPGLTPREKEVLVYLAEGASTKEIADKLGLQIVTVKLHVRGVCRKLNAKNRTQAALKAQELGLNASNNPLS